MKVKIAKTKGEKNSFFFLKQQAEWKSSLEARLW